MEFTTTSSMSRIDFDRLTLYFIMKLCSRMPERSDAISYESRHVTRNTIWSESPKKSHIDYVRSLRGVARLDKPNGGHPPPLPFSSLFSYLRSLRIPEFTTKRRYQISVKLFFFQTIKVYILIGAHISIRFFSENRHVYFKYKIVWPSRLIGRRHMSRRQNMVIPAIVTSPLL